MKKFGYWAVVKTAQRGVAGATLTSASSQLPFVAQFYEPGSIGPIGQGYCSILFLVYIDAQEYWAYSWSQSIFAAKKYYDNIFIPDICHGRHGHVRVKFFGQCKFLQI